MNGDAFYLNDELIDLNDQSVIAISSQINKLEDLRNHQSNLTNKFKVPKTKNNIRILENSETLQSSTNIPYEKNGAKLIKAGVEVVRNGFAVVESTDKFYNITVYSGNLDFFELIEGKKLSDLDLSALNHDFTQANIWDSINSTSVDGYIYPIINYGQLTNDTRTLDPSYLRLCVFVAYLFRKIIEEAGFVYESDFIDGDFFNSLILTCQNDNESPYYNVNSRITLGDPRPEPPILASPPHNMLIVNDGETWSYSMNLTFHISAWGGSSFFTIRIILPDATGLTIIGDSLYSHTAGVGTFTINLSWVTLGNDTTMTGLTPEIFLHTLNAQYEVLHGDITGSNADSILTTPDFFVHIMPIALTTSLNYFLGYDLLLGYGYTNIEVSKTLPDMDQKTFIKALAQMGSLIFKTDTVRKKIYIKQFSEITSNTKNAKDWTNKLHALDQSLDYRLGDYAQKNSCIYKEDSNDKAIPKQYGNGNILIRDKTLATTADQISLPFAASYGQKKLQNLDVPSVKRIDDDSGEWKIKTEPRILILEMEILPSPDYTYDDLINTPLTTNALPLCWFIRENKTYNLGFENNILSTNYTALTQVLNQTKRINDWFKLSAVDVSQFTEGDPNIEGHFIPVYLAQFSAYFYVTKINNYTGKGLTKCELVRIGKKNVGLIGAVERFWMFDPENYGVMNRNWGSIAGDHKFTLLSMVLDGTEYASAQTLTVTSPTDLIVGPGLDGNNHFQNISDWISSLMPEGWKAYDDMNAIDIPAGLRFEIKINYQDLTHSGHDGNITYKNEGCIWFLSGSVVAPVYTSQIL